jgi:hypothetical protein
MKMKNLRMVVLRKEEKAPGLSATTAALAALSGLATSGLGRLCRDSAHRNARHVVCMGQCSDQGSPTRLQIAFYPSASICKIHVHLYDARNRLQRLADMFDTGPTGHALDIQFNRIHFNHLLFQSYKNVIGHVRFRRRIGQTVLSHVEGNAAPAARSAHRIYKIANASKPLR